MSRLGFDLALGTDERSRADLTRIAVRADDLGVRALWLTEGVGRDVFTVLTELALATDHVELGTGIVNVFARTPAMLVQSSASVLEVLAGRRFNLGLGTSGRALVEKAYGVPFERPVARLADTVRLVDRAFRDHRVGDFPLKVDTDRERLRIFVAGLGSRSLRVTGSLADGWLPIWPSLARSDGLRREVDQAAADAGRPRPEVAGYVYGAVGGDVERQVVRDTLAWYVAANGTAYRHLFERYGYGPETTVIAELWQAGRRDEARRAVTDAMLDDTAIAGPAGYFRQSVAHFAAAGLDRVVWRVPGRLPTDGVLAMLDELAAVNERPLAALR